jgi:acyl-coenzyme A thioesterase PaaI-like protein
MTVRLGAEVDELLRLAAATPAHRRFGITSLATEPGQLPRVHEMTVGPDLLDSTDDLDLGVLALVADPSCAAAAANLCPPGAVPVTRSLRLESIRALRRDELPCGVVATAEPAWTVGHDVLLARGLVRSDHGDPLALMTLVGVTVHVPDARQTAPEVPVDLEPAPFHVGELTRDGVLWCAAVWAGAACTNLGGQVHGGVSALLASRVASRVHRAAGPSPVVPLDHAVEFLRPLPTGSTITAVAKLVPGSRRFPQVEGAFYVADREVLRFVSTAMRAREAVS